MPATSKQLNFFEPARPVSTRELPVTLVISGDTPSKKNSKRRIQRGKHIFMVPSKAHEDWHKAAMRELEWDDAPLPDGLAIEICIHPSTMRAADLSNKAESILDLLVDRGVIRDDSWWVVPLVTLRFGGVDRLRPRAEVVISR